ncbi:hypothetical protein ACFVIM_01445 [Streptomyces sp. NPDC057638]|uniref:hypothetical protein n=1 Tax=Streptomyces sp. NPDC057638 TaxID=3346190 RepID=UPI003680198F
MYELRYDTTVKAVLDSLPQAARVELREAMIRVCKDPYATTVPYGVDDGMTRHLVLSHTMAVLLITHIPAKAVRILQVTHLQIR